MKTSRLVAAVLFFVSGTVACRANLGESEAQCIARFGSEFDVRDSVGYRQVGDKAASFHLKTANATLDIRVVFLNGLSCHETYSNTDSSQGLSIDQMKSLLDAQAAGLKWSKGRSVYHTGTSSTTYGSVDWLRSDGATARFWMSGKADTQIQTGEVEISTKQYAYAQHIFDKENGEN